MAARADFKEVLRRGGRARGKALVLHYQAGQGQEDTPALAGFVISKKAVAKATRRNRIRRRLKAALLPILPNLPGGSRLIVRVMPGAETITYRELSTELHKLFSRCGHQTQSNKNNRQERTTAVAILKEHTNE